MKLHAFIIVNNMKLINYIYNINLHNFKNEDYKKLYIEGKTNINGKNIEIYINIKKRQFNLILIPRAKEL